MLRLMHNDLQGRLGDYAKRVLPAMQRSADEIEELGCKLAAMTAAKNKAVEALKACYAHAEDMTCVLDNTDDTSDYPYLERARQLITELEEVK